MRHGILRKKLNINKNVDSPIHYEEGFKAPLFCGWKSGTWGRKALIISTGKELNG